MQLPNSFGKALTAIALVVGAMGGAHAQKDPAVSAQISSVTTVDALVKIDNAAALEKAKADAIKNGLLKPEQKAGSGPLAKPVEPPPVVRVTSISGVRDELNASLTYNGQSYQNLRVGGSVRGCVVAEVKDRCVVLAPAKSETVVAATTPDAPAVKGKGKRTKSSVAAASVPATRPEMCPKACWTGINVVQAPMAQGNFTGSPVGLPGGVQPPLPRPAAFAPQVAPQTAPQFVPQAPTGAQQGENSASSFN